MKKNAIFLFTVTVIVLSGCKYFKKPAVENVTAIKADSAAGQLSVTDETVPETFVNQGQQFSAVQRGNYYMIVGCFTIQANAETYASALRQKGYSTTILPGRDNMQMVSVQTYNNYSASIADIAKYRTEVTSGAWVHVAR